MFEGNFRLDDKIKTVEILIEDFRWARANSMVPEHRTYLVLKALVEDLRARQRIPRFSVIEELQEAVDAAAATKTRAGYEMGKTQNIGERVMGRWPLVRQALEHFAADAEVET